MSNGFWDDITDLLGSGGPSLKQIKAMAATVKPDAMIAMSDVFDNGSNAATDNGTQLSTAIDKVIGGWRGKAADAASTSVLQTSRTSHDLGTMSSNYAQSIREYATKIQGLQHQIAAVKDVDTSFATAMKHSGGPAGLILNPGGVGQQMMKAQLQAEQHRKQAQGHLDTMNDAGSTVAPTGGAFPSRSQPGIAADAPDQLRIERHGAQSGSRRDVVTVPGTRDYRAGTASTSRTSSGDAGRSTARPGAGVPQPGGHGSHGSDDTTTTSSAGDIAVGPPTSSAPIAAEPVSSGGGGLGLAGGLAAGGGALAAGAGLASRGPAFATGRGGSGSGGRGGVAGGEAPGGRGAGGRGGAESFERGTAGRGAPGEPGVARPGAGEPVGARAAAFGPAAAGEAAAGRPGYLPPAGGAGGRGNEDDELNARPDYLVETDDLWGDGRLAAPPVLG